MYNIDIDVKSLLSEFKKGIKLEFTKEIFEEGRKLSSKDILLPGTNAGQDPEVYTKNQLITPIIKQVLNFGIIEGEEVHYTLTNYDLRTKSGKKRKRKVDYVLINMSNSCKILIEAKAFNGNLGIDQGSNDSESAVSQIRILFKYNEKIINEFSYGIATDGKKWIIISRSGRIKEELDIEADIERIVYYLVGLADLTTEQKDEEEISDKFYQGYQALIFGGTYKNRENKRCIIDEKDALVNSISGIPKYKDRVKFAHLLINRLIFIRFLQERKIIPTTIFKSLINTETALVYPKLNQLFFEVLNTPLNKRNAELSVEYQMIPYLNGSLFSLTSVEKKYIGNRITVSGKTLKLIFNFLETYHFIDLDSPLDENSLDPEILGYIFERSINKPLQKKTGSYYTPKNITKLMSRELVIKYIISEINKKRKREKLPIIINFEDLWDLSEEEIQFILDKLRMIRICDCACGSGAFLIAIAEVLFDIMRMLESQLGLTDSDLFLRKQIVKNNIFGVDINSTAVEIAKLRLWLWVASVYNRDTIEPLPNTEFNIRVGNSLIGFIEISAYYEFRLVGLDKFFDEGSKIEQLLDKKTKLLKEYKKGGIKGSQLKPQILSINSSIKDHLSRDFYTKYVTPRIKGMSYEEFLSTLKPFHWALEFEKIFSLKRSGFDIIISNPPYGNILETHEKALLFDYKTKDVNEVAANFLERSLLLLKKDGFIGLVLANSIAINSSTSICRKKIRDKFSRSNMALFGTRPSKLFVGAEIRALIFSGKMDLPRKTGIIYTTEAIKFRKSELNFIERRIIYENTDKILLGDTKIGELDEKQLQVDSSLPKVGFPIIRRILLKLSKNISTFDLLCIDNNNEHLTSKEDFKLQTRTTGGYWLNALFLFPYTSTKIKTLVFNRNVDRDFAIIIINSSLFYLYWSTYSNLRDFPMSLFLRFPIPNIEEINKNKEEINRLALEIDSGLNSCFLPNVGRNGEFRTAQCRNIIDKIDRFIGKFYKLTEKEINFIIEYDSMIRPNIESNANNNQ